MVNKLFETEDSSYELTPNELKICFTVWVNLIKLRVVKIMDILKLKINKSNQFHLDIHVLNAKGIDQKVQNAYFF